MPFQRDACVAKAIFDQLQLVRLQLLGLGQHVLAHADLAEIVQQRGVAKFTQFVPAEADVAQPGAVDTIDRDRQALGKTGDAEGMAGGDRIARLDGLHRGADETFEQLFDIGVENAVLQGHTGLSGQRHGHALILGIEGSYVQVHRFLVRQPHLRIVLAVDELEHTDDFISLVGQRQGQQRARVITTGAVETRIELVRSARVDGVDIVDDQDLAATGDIAGDAVLAGGYLLRILGIACGRILPKTEIQRPAGIACVDGSAIGIRQRPGMGEDQPKQGVEILLRSQRAPDFQHTLEHLSGTVTVRSRPRQGRG